MAVEFTCAGAARTRTRCSIIILLFKAVKLLLV